MADLQAGTATAELVIDASDIEGQLNATFAQIGKLVSAQEKKIAESSGFEALGKQIEQFARATAQAESQIRSLRFDAIATEVGQLTSALKGAESGIQVTEDLAKAESLLEERFALVRAEIQRQAEAQRGLVDEETLLERTTLQLEAAQRQHDAAMATVRGRAIQAAEGLAQLEAEEQASALAAQKAWEAVGRLAQEQQKAEDESRQLAAQEAETAAGLARLGEAISHAAAETQKSNQQWANLKKGLSETVDGALAVGAAFSAFAGGVAAVAGASAKLTMEAAHIGESFNDLAIKTSTSVEALSRYDLAAQTAGVSQDTLAVGMRKLAQAAVEAGDDGSESAKAFKSLGVEVTGANGQIKPMGQLLQETTRALADAGEGADTMAAAQQLLGRSALDFLPLAKMTKEEMDDLALASEQLGLTWSTKDAAAADKLSDSVTVLGSGVKGLGTSIGRDLIPVAQEMVDASLKWLRANSDLIRSGLKEWAEGVAVILRGLAPVVRDVADATRDMYAWMSGGLDNTFGGLNQQIADTEAKMASMVKTAKDTGWADGVVEASKKYKELANELEGLKVRAEQAKNAQPPLAAAVDGVTGSLRDQKVVAKETGEQFDAMLINWEDANKAAEEAKRKQKEAADEAKRLSEANKQLQQSIDQLKLDAVADDLDAATKAMERSRTVVADESYLRALQDIQTQYEAQVQAAKDSAAAAVQAGADRSKAAEMEALAVDKAQRQMADAVESLNEPLQKNAETWGKLGDQILELPDEVRAFIPTLDGIAAATGKVDEATFGMVKATEAVPPAAEAASGTISDLSKAIVGLLDNTSNAGDVLQAFAGGLVDNLGGAVSKALTSSQFGKDLTSSLSGVFGPALGSAIATAGMSAVVQVGAGIFMSGVKDAMEGEAMSSAAKIGLVVGGPIGAAIGVGIVSAFGIGHKSMVEQIAAELGEMFKESFRADAVVQAINDGLVEVGTFLGPGLERLMIRAPKDMGAQVTEAWKKLGTDSSYQFSDGFYQDMKEKGTQLIHSSIADVLHVFYKDISNDVAIGIQQSAIAAGAAIAGEMGLLGNKAIKFAEQWAIAFIGMGQKAGLSADEILTALHRIDSSLGTSQELAAAFDRLNAAIIDSGADMDALYSQIEAQLKVVTGKKVSIGNLSDVLKAVGGDATRALGVIENGMEMAGISIEKFTGQLSDVVLAISGDAGTAIKEAGQDFRDFGNDADGTAQILREKVLTALDNVIKSAEELGYSAESMDAFRSAVALIPPEMMKSAEFTNKLREDFARMAVESHMSVQELVDSIDPPLPEATRNAILAVNDLGKAIGDLTGAPLKSLKEVTDRMKQFGSEMYREVKDAEGNVTRELTAFGQELIDEASTAISGMWSQMNEDGWVGLDEIGVMFDQLALLPIEALNDPAIQQATRDLLAKIGAMTGDAAIIAMANAETITQDMIAQGLAAYDEYKKTVEENPPEVPPPTTPDGQPTTGPDGQPTGPDTTPASTAPPPAPIPPETLKSWEEINAAATAYATAVLAGRDAVEALAATTTTSAAAMLAAIRPIYGEPTDDGSLASIERIFHDLKEFLDGDGTQSFKDFGIAGSEAVSSIFTAAGNATSAMHSLTDSEWVVKVRYEVTGAPPPTPTPGTLPKSHSGELIPGTPGTESLRIVEAGEWIWPAGLTEKLLSGSALALPASMASRVNRAAAVPAVRGGGMGGARGASSRDSDAGLVSVRMSRQDAADALVAPIFVRLEDENGAGRVHFRDAKGRPVKMSVDAHVRGKARAR